MKRLLAPGATVLGVAVALRVIYDAWYLNYDARYALLWARDIGRGFSPEYEAPFAPTPHPLSTAWSGLGVLFGDWVIVWGTLLAFGLLVYLAYRLGAELFSPAVGVITALVVLTRPAMERDALLGYQDVPFAVLIVFAALLAYRRRSVAVLVVLAVAGLIRPEAWVLAGLYWLIAVRVWKLVPLVAVAPAIWALTDFIVTGDALHSLHGTSELAEAVGRRRDVEDSPYWTVQYFAYTLRQPLGIGIPIGIAFAWRHRERYGRAAVLLLSVALSLTLVFMVNPAFGLPLIGRYVRTPSVLLAVFFGVALAGWTFATRDKRVWQALAALTAVIALIFVPANVKLLRGMDERFKRDGLIYADLQKVGESEKVRALLDECGPIVAADHRPMAHLRYWLDSDPGSVDTIEGVKDPRPRTLVAPKDNVRNRIFFGENFPRTKEFRPGPLVYDNRSWFVFADPECVG